MLGVVARDVAFGLESAGHPPARIPGAWRGAGAVGAGHLSQRRIAGLSGGERQRVAVAAVLACRPRCCCWMSHLATGRCGAAALTEVVRALADAGTAWSSPSTGANGAPVADRLLRVQHGRRSRPVRTPRRIARCPGARGGAPRARGHRCGYRAGRSSPTRAATVRGTVTALRGPNGSGKTLIARIIAGLHRPRAVRAAGGVDVTTRAATPVPGLAW